MRLAETRVRVGAGNEEDVYISRASLGTYRDSLRQIEQARLESIRALEILLGRYPAAAATVSSRLPAQPAAIPAGLPSELARTASRCDRRGAPDRRRLQPASGGQGGAAAGDRLDRGRQHDLERSVRAAGSRQSRLERGARLLAPVFRGGALKTQVDIRTAEQAQAIAAYAAVGLRAFGEVENALAAEIAARDREQILAQTLVGLSARAGSRAHAVQGGQHRPALRDAASAHPERRAVGARARADRAARAARQSAPRAWTEASSLARSGAGHFHRARRIRHTRRACRDCRGCRARRRLHHSRTSSATGTRCPFPRGDDLGHAEQQPLLLSRKWFQSRALRYADTSTSSENAPSLMNLTRTDVRSTSDISSNIAWMPPTTARNCSGVVS